MTMPTIQTRDRREYGRGYEPVSVRVDRQEWDEFCALMAQEYNTNASDGVRQLVANVVRQHRVRGMRNAGAS